MSANFGVFNFSLNTELYRKAADQGNASALILLGVMYDNGKGGLTKSREKAVELWRKAAAQGNEAAKAILMRLEEVEN